MDCRFADASSYVKITGKYELKIQQIIKKIFCILLLSATVFVLSPSAEANVKTQKEARAKINQLKWLEKVEVKKLYKNQQKLETASTTLKSSKEVYNSTAMELYDMEAKLSEALSLYSALDYQLKGRIRQIYKSQRKGFFIVLLSASDFNTFLDRIYFERIIINADYSKMILAKQRAKNVAMLKFNVEEKRRLLARSIKNINNQQQTIQREIEQNENMIHKLRTDRVAYERSERELAKQSKSIGTMITRTSRGTEIQVASAFIKPISGRVTSPFGWRTHPIFKSRTFHSGIDIGGPYRGNVRASNSGKVIYTGWYGGYGKVVIIDHGSVNGKMTTTLYAHLDSIRVNNGAYVSKGQVVGHEGTTGYSTGPHVHFEVRINGNPNNPLNYI